VKIKPMQFTSAGLNVTDIYKGLQNQNTNEKGKASIVLAKYQLKNARRYS
jgi:hypothetical protein